MYCIQILDSRKKRMGFIGTERLFLDTYHMKKDALRQHSAREH